MAPIPQELQDAWDAASQAKTDHEDSVVKLTSLEDQEYAVSKDLALAKADESAKAAVADSARLNFDQTADKLLTATAGDTPPTPAAPALKTPAAA